MSESVLGRKRLDLGDRAVLIEVRAIGDELDELTLFVRGALFSADVVCTNLKRRARAYRAANDALANAQCLPLHPGRCRATTRARGLTFHCDKHSGHEGEHQGADVHWPAATVCNDCGDVTSRNAPCSCPEREP